MTTAVTKQIIFIDAAINNVQAILDSLPQGAEVIRLDANIDGLSQIATALAQHRDVTGVHIFSHGSAGVLQLGSVTIGLNSFDTHSADFAVIRASLKQGADLLLYGCDVAAGPTGQAFMATLAAATGADVAASTNLTGATSLGGDWTLEASTGSIETATIAANAMQGTLAAPTINGLAPSITYTEGAQAIAVNNNVTFNGGSAYGGGYVRYEVGSANGADVLQLQSAANANAAGAVTVDDGTVYLGNGTGKDAIGSIDANFNGVNGKALQVNFSANFTNPSFEANGGSVTGWTIGNQWVNLGTTVIGGFVSPEDTTFAPNSGGDNEAPVSASFNSQIAAGGSTASPGGGNSSLRLYSDMQTAQGYDTVHGPYAMSNVFEASKGDVLYFDWKAAGGSDAFDAFGYLLNAQTGQATVVLNRTGANASETTPWTTASVTVPTSGDYRFVFVSGTWDATGGRAAGGSLYVDNFKVFGNKVTDAVTTSIAQQITYQNTAHDAPPSRTLTITAADGNGAKTTATTTLNVAGVNDAPVFTGGAMLAGVLEDAANPIGATVSSLFGNKFTDADNTYSPTDSLGGIVITGNAASVAQGKWQYSTDGSNWNDVGAVSNASGLVLAATAKLRFLPGADYPSGSVAHNAAAAPGGLTIHAVDSSYAGAYTNGPGRQLFDTTTDDATSAVSAGGVSLGTTVTEVNDAPRFDSTPASGALADTDAYDAGGAIAAAGTGMSGTLAAHDVESDTFSYGIRGGNDDGHGHIVRTGLYGTLSIDKASGAWTYTPNEVAVNALPANTNVIDHFEFRVTDSLGASSVQTYDVNISGVNDKPLAHAGKMPDVSATTSDWAYQLPSTAFTDAEGSGLTYTATLADGSALPNEIKFDAASRTFSTKGADIGDYEIKVTASDGEYSVSDTFKLTVGNSAPVLSAPIAPKVVADNPAYTVSIPDTTFTDPDGDPLSYTVLVNGLDVTGANGTSAFSFDPLTGKLTGDSTTANDTNLVEVRANDGSTTSSTTFALTFDRGNHPTSTAGTPVPEHTWTGAGDKQFQLPAGSFQLDKAGVAQTFKATLSDGTTALPAWLHFDEQTGTFSGNPPDGSAGKLNLLVTAFENGAATSATQPVVLNIVDPNDAPTLIGSQALGDKTHTDTSNFSFTFGDLFDDADGPSADIAYSAKLADGSPLPSWLTFNAATHTFSGVPTGGTPYLNIVVTGTDAGGKSASSSFTLNLQDVTDTATVGTNDTNTVGVVNIVDQNGGTLLQNDVLKATVTDANNGNQNVNVVYQWQASSDNGATWNDIANATGDQFTLGQAQVGKQVRVQAFYLDGGGVAESPVANALGPVVNVNDAGVLTFSGSLSVGSELRATLSDIDGLSGAIPTYQWETSTDNGATWTAIDGATYSTYTITNADGGKHIHVKATYTDDQNTTETATATGSKIALGSVAPVASNVNVDAVERGGQNNSAGGQNPTGDLFAAVTDANAGDTKAIQSLRVGSSEGLGSDARDDGAFLVIQGNYGTLTVNKATGAYVYEVDQNQGDVQKMNVGSSLIDAFNYTVVDRDGLTDTAVLTVTVKGANDAPVVLATPTVSVIEDTEATIDLSNVNITDSDGGTGFSFKLVASEGTLAAADGTGVTVTGSGTGTLVLTGSMSDVNAYLKNLAAIKYTGALDDNGAPGAVISLYANDGGGDVKVSEASVSITAVNDAPAGTNGVVTTLEDTPYALQAADFGFTDPKDAVSNTANQLASVTITTLPTAGKLTLGGVAVEAGQRVTVADIGAGKLVFAPVADANGQGHSSFTFQVQDDGGTANSGADFDLSPNTLTIDVTPVNDAPVLVNAGTSTPHLSVIDENNVASAGNLIGDLVRPVDGASTPAAGEERSFFTDVDFATKGTVGAPGERWDGGVAIYNLKNEGPADGGTWQFSTDNGTTWNAVGAVAAGQALLLASTDKLRFVPDTDNGAIATFDYYLWDGSSGTHGTKASVEVRGGTTAFSLAGDKASISVTHVNDAPTLDLDANVAGTGYKADFLIRGNAVAIAAPTMKIADVDKLGATQPDTITSATVAITSGAIDNESGAIYETLNSSFGANYAGSLGTIVISGNGTPSLSLSGAGTWADYEAAIKSVSYRNANPNAYHGERTVTVTVRDGSITDPGHSLSATAVTTIDNIWAPAIDTNGGAEGLIYTTTYTEDDAPVRIASADSTITDEDSHLKSVVVSISNVKDAGSETLGIPAATVTTLTGLGLTVTGNGTTSITLSGDIAPSLYQRALRAITYENTSQHPDQAQRVITIQSTDIDNHKGDVGYSHINVVSVQDAPAALPPRGPVPGTVAGDPGYGPGVKELPSNFVDVDGDVLKYSATLDDGSPLPTWLKIDPDTGTLRGNPPAGLDGKTLTIKVTATDPFGNKGTDTFTWSFKDTNDLPVVTTPIPDQAKNGSGTFSFPIPTNTFTDGDGEKLDYTVGLADGNGGGTKPLPAWLHFDPLTNTFSGNPPAGAESPLTVRVKVTDAAGATVYDDFVVNLSGNLNDVPTVGKQPVPPQFTTGTALDYKLPSDTFVDGDGDPLHITAVVVNADGSTGPLPSWLTFDESTGTFSGKTGEAVNLTIRLTGTDASGTAASTEFKLASQAPFSPPSTPVDGDNDGQPDNEEMGLDTDKDGIPDNLDTDDDNDGIDSTTESKAPALHTGGLSGDGNGDGIADTRQANVSSAPLVRHDIKNADGSAMQSYVTLVADSHEGKVDAGSLSKLLTFEQIDSPGYLPVGMSHPMGMIAFTSKVAQAGATESFSLYVDKSVAVNGYWKVDKYGDWVNLASEEYGGKVVAEGNKLRLDFKITDGGQFDEDGKADGIITDPGAAGWGITTKLADDMDNDQFPDHLEAANGLTVGTKDNDVFGSSKLFVMQMYRDTLFREAESGGLDFWKGLIDKGTLDRAQVANAFLHSAEFQSMAGTVARLYLGAMDRVPDDAGLSAWLGAMKGGMTQAEVAKGFAESAEFKTIYGALDNASFISQLYHNVLDRAVGASELQAWTKSMDNGASRGDVLLALSESAENIAHMDGTVTVALAYTGLLGRTPDSAGFDFWMDKIEHGVSQEAVIGAFIGVPEFHDRFLP
ncbi:DUF4347 domain-containing protein [Massilia sp. G4R7]|uniref:DUF4347 domain-containing protein n=1 Tax=Massilia phyllostachyos TaxID=2898585 RepID=A0ABS8Q178_9BURK|nr:putative Ig domain-containing protein [Massilia phyllostachyos]MCD2515334.1 DUF4347 domain-containing protein [Massilia phyllostachyos]